MKSVFTILLLLLGPITFGQSNSSAPIYAKEGMNAAGERIPEHEFEQPAKPIRTTPPAQGQEQMPRYFENPPTFPGGNKAWKHFMEDNVQYPYTSVHLAGTVVMCFMVLEDGSITDIKVLRSVDPTLDQYAIDLIKKMPKWIPANANGKSVQAPYTMPVRFR